MIEDQILHRIRRWKGKVYVIKDIIKDGKVRCFALSANSEREEWREFPEGGPYPDRGYYCEWRGDD